MKLLICTQAVDRNDPYLGFFHSWIEEFARQCDAVHVITLQLGAHEFSANVTVESLGKRERRASRLFERALFALRFLIRAWRARDAYDAVFVHMNPEYVVLAGWWWRLLKKRVALWYVHKNVNAKLRVATVLANAVLTASPESFRIPSRRVHVLQHGIDTRLFNPNGHVQREKHVLSVGRLMPSKHHDLAIRAAAYLHMPLRIAGEGQEEKHLRELALRVSADTVFLGGLRQEALRDEYRRAFALVHTSQTGSLDKVVLEALACGCPVVSVSDCLGGIPIVRADANPESIARAVEGLFASPPRAEDLARFVREHHNLPNLITQIVSVFEAL